MSLPKININTSRLMSSSTNSKGTSFSSPSSSSSSNKSKELNTLPILIQLCFYPDENYAYRTMRSLLSSRYDYSPDVYDEFGCNVLMYSLRYQRYRLFEFLLNNLSLELNLQAKDRLGNTILHYAIIYGGNDTQIIEKLIEKYKKLAIKIDERNHFGFTPLLLAAFCGRYDFVLTLLTKANASPFVRDYIQLKNLFDYLEIDAKHKECQHRQTSFCSNPETKRLIYQLYQTLPTRRKTYTYKNFFEIFFLRSIEDRTSLLRSLIIELFEFDYLNNLLNYLNQRYPRIQTARRLSDIPSTTKFTIQRENSKIDLHNILNLFDPQLKPKAISPPQIVIPTPKASLRFKKLGTKVATLSAFSKIQTDKKRSLLTTTRVK